MPPRGPAVWKTRLTVICHDHYPRHHRRALVAEAERSFGRELRKVRARPAVALAELDRPGPIDDFPDKRCLHQVANRRAIADTHYSEAPRLNERVPGNLAPGNWVPDNPG